MGPPDEEPEADHKLTLWQKQALKSLAKYARKRPGEPLASADWQAYFEFAAQPQSRAIKRIMRALPQTPRCGFCGAPFAGIGSRLVGPLGYRPSRKNPNLCATCIELAPPGGMTTDIGVLFADIRGFTSQSESITPERASVLLRQFYACAEQVLFPEAMIDKLIGDEVMALYVPRLISDGSDGGRGPWDRRRIAKLMLDHARRLLQRVGYGTPDGPAFQVGVGLDFGEAFVGNIGDTAVHDFTAVGDVVNTASRLQGHASPGQVVLSERLAQLLETAPGVTEEIVVKGKQEPVAVRRLSWFEEVASS